MRLAQFYTVSSRSDKFAGWELVAKALGLKVTTGLLGFGRIEYVVRVRGSDDVVTLLVDPHRGTCSSISDPSVIQMLILANLVQAGIVHTVSRLV